MHRKLVESLCLVCLIAGLVVPNCALASDATTDNSTGSDVPQISGLLARQAGLMDTNSIEYRGWEQVLSKSDLDDSTYLRPRQVLSQEDDNFDLWVWGCNYAVAEYYFYANPGYIDITIDPALGQDVVAILRTNGGYPTPGSNVLIMDSGGQSWIESDYYWNDDRQLFVLLVGFNSIDGCDPDMGVYIDPVRVSLEYEPYEWDLPLIISRQAPATQRTPPSSRLLFGTTVPTL